MSFIVIYCILYSLIVDQCGTFTGNVISSPSFDEDQDMEIYCESIMYLYTNETVLITFLSIGIVESERCTKGYVEVNTVKPVFSDHIKQDISLAFQTGVCLLLHELSALLSFSNKQPPVNSEFHVT